MEPDAPAPSGAGTPETLADLSPSRASDFKTCPQLFKFRHIDQIPAVPTHPQARGTAIHLALERLFEIPAGERHPERLLELFEVAWDETLRSEEYRELFAEDPEDREEVYQASRKIAEKYFKIEDPRLVEPLAREHFITLMIGTGRRSSDPDRQLEVRGIIDRMDPTPEGGIVITDYKTGKAPPLRYADSSFFALKVYALMVERESGKTPNLIRLLYLGNSVAYNQSVSKRQLAVVEKQLQALWDAIDLAITRNTFPPRTSRLCDWCSYQSICPAWVDQSPPVNPRVASRSAKEPLPTSSG